MKNVKRGTAIAIAVTMAIGTMGTAHSETSPETTAAKELLDIQTQEVQLAKAKVELSKSLVPNLKDYKTAKPEVPTVDATVTTIAFTQTEKLAKDISIEIYKKLSDKKATQVLVDNKYLLDYIAAADSVETRLGLASSALEQSTSALQKLITQLKAPPAKPSNVNPQGPINQGSPVISRYGHILSSPTGIAGVLPALVETFFSVGSALKSQYTFSSQPHIDLADAALKSQVFSYLTTQGIAVIDPEAFAPLKRQTSLQGTLQTVKDQVKSAGSLIKTGNELLEQQKEAKKADLLTAQINVVVAVVKEANKLLMEISTPVDGSITPLAAADRGTWLREKLNGEAPLRLDVTTLASTTDMVAADGFFKGLRIAIHSNTIAQWRLVDAEGGLYTGVVQACGPNAKQACDGVLLRPDEIVSPR